MLYFEPRHRCIYFDPYGDPYIKIISMIQREVQTWNLSNAIHSIYHTCFDETWYRVYSEDMPLVHTLPWSVSREKRLFLYSNGSPVCRTLSWWRHQMETLSALLALCAGNSPVTGEFPSQKPVTQSFDVFFHLCLNKRLSKQWWGWWFETPSRSLWCHCNDNFARFKRNVVPL